jgi:aromatic ring-opening dioxygenase LigB subunit
VYNGKASYIVDLYHEKEDCSGSITLGSATVADGSCILSDDSDYGSAKVTATSEKVTVSKYSDQSCSKLLNTEETNVANAGKCTSGVKSIVELKDGSSSKSDTSNSNGVKISMIWSLGLVVAVLLMY